MSFQWSRNNIYFWGSKIILMNNVHIIVYIIKQGVCIECGCTTPTIGGAVVPPCTYFTAFNSYIVYILIITVSL